MAGIGILLDGAILSQGDDIQFYKFSQIMERGDSGTTLRRQAGRGERAIAGIASTAEVHCVAEEITPTAYEWLVERLGLPIQLRVPDLSARVFVKSVERNRIAARSDTDAWGVRVVFYIIERN